MFLKKISRVTPLRLVHPELRHIIYIYILPEAALTYINPSPLQPPCGTCRVSNGFRHLSRSPNFPVYPPKGVLLTIKYTTKTEMSPRPKDSTGGYI